MTNKKDFINLVMNRIEKEKIKIRSKYIVWTVNFIKNGVFVTSLTANALFISFIFYWLKSTQNLDFLAFGKLGLFAFLQSLPYLWLLTSFMFFVITSFILKQYDISYKKPYKLLVVLILIFTGFSGGIMNATGANKLIAEQIKERQKKRNEKEIEAFLKPIWDDEVGINGKNGIYGEVIEVEPGVLQLCVDEESIEVTFDKKAKKYTGEKIQENDWIRAVGINKDGGFEAIEMKKMEKKQNSQNNAPNSPKKEPLQEQNKGR